MSVNDGRRQQVSVLVFAASLREDSINSMLARIAARALELQGATIDHATMREFDTPSYDQDVEDSDGIPAGAAELRRRLEAADAFVIASPEYNAAMPGVLENSIDWASRFRPSRSTDGTACCCLHRRPWSAATGGCGRCACRSSTSAPASTQTCSPSPRRRRS